MIDRCSSRTVDQRSKRRRVTSPVMQSRKVASTRRSLRLAATPDRKTPTTLQPYPSRSQRGEPTKVTRGVRSPPLPTDDDDAIPDTRATVGFIVAGPATGEALPTSPRSRRQDRQPLGCVESQTSVTNPAADEGVETQAMPRVLALGLERPAPTPPTQRNSLLQSILTTGPPDDPSASVEPGQNPTPG